MVCGVRLEVRKVKRVEEHEKNGMMCTISIKGQPRGGIASKGDPKKMKFYHGGHEVQTRKAVGGLEHKTGDPSIL